MLSLENDRNEEISQESNILYSSKRKIDSVSLDCPANLDYFSTVYRNSGKLCPEMKNRIYCLISKMWIEDPSMCVKNIFNKRDCLCGSGERLIFYYSCDAIYRLCPEVFMNIILPNIPVFGYWKDYLNLIEIDSIKLTPIIARIFGKQLAKEFSDKISNSLAAKWAPSVKSCFDKKYGLARLIAKEANLPYRNWQQSYRKMLTTLRGNGVEQKMCSKTWESIEVKEVPKLALNKYKNALMEHIPEKYKEFLQSIKKNIEDYISPHKLVSITFLYTAECQSTWEKMRSHIKIKGNLSQDISVCDLSAGAFGLSLDLRISLSLLISELSPHPFNEHIMLKTSNLKFKKVKGPLYDKVVGLHGTVKDFYPIDIIRCYMLIFERCIKYNLLPNKIPHRIFIFSDKEFETGTINNDIYSYTTVSTLYSQAKYTMPTLYFWNLNGIYNATIPYVKNNFGYTLNGWHFNFFNYMVEYYELPEPYSVMINVLGDDRYDLISTVA